MRLVNLNDKMGEIYLEENVGMGLLLISVA